jgi:uncharacterized protein (UPF0332 family)
VDADLWRNAEEFLASAEENTKRERYNAAVSDYFKTIVILCDVLLYQEWRILPKNHNERFDLLRQHAPDIHRKVSRLFKLYTQSYNLRSTAAEATQVKEYALELRARLAQAPAQKDARRPARP